MQDRAGEYGTRQEHVSAVDTQVTRDVHEGFATVASRIACRKVSW